MIQDKKISENERANLDLMGKIEVLVFSELEKLSVSPAQALGIMEAVKFQILTQAHEKAKNPERN